MGGKHTVLTDDLHVVMGEGGPARAPGVLIQQFQGEQAGMPLIHMKAGEVRIAERPQHAHPTDPQQHFLAQPVVGITAVQRIGQGAVPGRVVRQIGIQKIHRHGEAPDAAHEVLPGAEVHGPPFDGDGGSRRHGLHKVMDGPGRPVPRVASHAHPGAGKNIPGGAGASPPPWEWWRSAAARTVSPARTPSPPLYVGMPTSSAISIEKYAMVLSVSMPVTPC